MKKHRKFVALVIVFSLVVCSGNLWGQERKSGELNLIAAGVTYWEV